MPPRLVRSARHLLVPALVLMVGPDYQHPQALLASDWIPRDGGSIGPSSEPIGPWWESFGDPILTNLIVEAYRQNPSLQAAGVRVLEAHARRGIAIGTLFPQVQNAVAAYSRNVASENVVTVPPERSFNDFLVGLDVGWELDFWGKFRRGIESADAQLLAAVADYDDVLVSLLAEVAANYIGIRTAQEELDVARRNAELQRSSFDIASRRAKAGAVTDVDPAQAATLLHATGAELRSLRWPDLQLGDPQLRANHEQRSCTGRRISGARQRVHEQCPPRAGGRRERDRGAPRCAASHGISPRERGRRRESRGSRRTPICGGRRGLHARPALPAVSRPAAGPARGQPRPGRAHDGDTPQEPRRRVGDVGGRERGLQRDRGADEIPNAMGRPARGAQTTEHRRGGQHRHRARSRLVALAMVEATVVTRRRTASAGPMLLGCLIAVAAGCGRETKASVPAPEVSVSQPVEEPVQETLEFTGRLSAVDSVEVRSRVTGFITKVAFAAGALVNKV